MTSPAPPTTAEDQAAAFEDYKQRLHAEWNTYVAVQDIYVGTALAVRAGNPVPVSNVERHGYLLNGLVRKVTPDEPGPADVDPMADAVHGPNDGPRPEGASIAGPTAPPVAADSSPAGEPEPEPEPVQASPRKRTSKAEGE